MRFSLDSGIIVLPALLYCVAYQDQRGCEFLSEMEFHQYLSRDNFCPAGDPLSFSHKLIDTILGGSIWMRFEGRCSFTHKKRGVDLLQLDASPNYRHLPLLLKIYTKTALVEPLLRNICGPQEQPNYNCAPIRTMTV